MNTGPHLKQLRLAVVVAVLLVLVAIQFRNAQVTFPCENSEDHEIVSQADPDKFNDSASATKRLFIGPKSLFETEEWKSLREKRRSNRSPDPSDKYFTAYLEMQRATEAMDSQPTSEAILRLKNALRGFEEIADTNPDWHPQVVEFRTQKLREQIAALKKQPDGV